MKRKRSPMEGAQEKGRQAARDGKKPSDCPYGDVRTMRGTVTYSRAFMKAWYDGYIEVKKGLVK